MRQFIRYLCLAGLLWLASAVPGRAYYPGFGGYALSCASCYNAVVSVTGTSSTALSPVPGTGLYAYVTHFSCWNSGATTTTVILQNGTGGTTIWGPATVTSTSGGFVVDFPTPIGGDTALGGGMTVATAVYFKAGSSTTSLTCNIAGYVAP